jgi:DNA-binding beta-propeller fold protein YncE
MAVTVAPRPLRYSHTIGALALTGRGFSNPIDLTIVPNGMLYVVNRSNSSQASQGAVRVTICTIDQEYIGTMAGFGEEEDGGLVWPTAITHDSQGNIYISDEHRNDVQVFNRDHEFVRKWGTLGSGPSDMNRPAGLATDGDDNIFVVDHMNNRIQKRRPDGTVVSQWGSAGSGPGELNLPWGICTDKDGNVYVADWRNDRVQKFTNDGQYISTIGRSGSGIGELSRPANVAVDEKGNVYVADWGNERVSVFTDLGFPLTTIIGDSEMSKWGAEFLSANQDLIEGRKIMADGTPEKRLHGPTAVEIDEQGRVIIVDSCRHRLQIYERV